MTFFESFVLWFDYIIVDTIRSFFVNLLNHDVLFFLTDLAVSYTNATNRESYIYFDIMFVFSAFLYGYLLTKRGLAGSDTSYAVYFLIVLFGSQALALADNLVEFVIAWVVLNVGLYGLILRSVTSYAAETVVKYFLVGAVTTGLVFFGLFLHFVQYGSVFYSSIEFLINSNITSMPVLSTAQSVAFLLVFVAFLFKLGAYPFHFYLPAMYEGIELEALGVVTIPVKWYTFLAMLNFVNAYGYAASSFYNFFLVLGIGSVFFGAYGAFVQQKLRSFWAYSYLSSIGFVFLGFAQNSLSLNITAGLVYFAVYMLTWTAIFWWLAVVRSRRLCEFNSVGMLVARNTELRYVAELVNVTQTPARVLIITLLFSLVGVPPTAGFFAKFSVLSGLMGSSFGFLILIMTLALMPVSAYNYLRLIRVMSFVGASTRPVVLAQVSTEYGSVERVLAVVLYFIILVAPIFVFMSLVG